MRFITVPITQRVERDQVCSGWACRRAVGRRREVPAASQRPLRAAVVSSYVVQMRAQYGHTASLQELATILVEEVFRPDVQDDETMRLIRRGAASGRSTKRKPAATANAEGGGVRSSAGAQLAAELEAPVVDALRASCDPLGRAVWSPALACPRRPGRPRSGCSWTVGSWYRRVRVAAPSIGLRMATKRKARRSDVVGRDPAESPWRVAGGLCDEPASARSPLRPHVSMTSSTRLATGLIVAHRP